MKVTAKSEDLFLRLKDSKASMGNLERRLSEIDVILNKMTAVVKLVEKSCTRENDRIQIEKTNDVLKRK